MAKYLNDTGLSYLWGKLTTLFMKKSDYVTAGGAGKVLASVDSDKLGGVLPSGYATASHTHTKTNITDFAHAAAHATGQADAISPASIGAQIAITGAASTVTTSNLTANRVLIAGLTGKIEVGTATPAQLVYVSDLTGYAQSQIDGKQPAVTANGILKANGSGTISAATAGTDYATPVAIVSDTAPTTKTIATLANNTEYRFGTLTALTVSAYPAGEYESLIVFTTNASGCTLSLPAGTKYGGGSALTLEAGKDYELSIKSGRVKAEWFA